LIDFLASLAFLFGGGATGEEIGESIAYAVYLRELLIALDMFFVSVVGAVGARRRRLRTACNIRGMCRCFVAEERVERISYAFDLLDLAVLDDAELNDFAVCRGEDGIRVGVKRADPGLELAVEELGKVAVSVEVGLCYFVEAAVRLVVGFNWCVCANIAYLTPKMKE
jgi:hypothetical protein